MEDHNCPAPIALNLYRLQRRVLQRSQIYESLNVSIGFSGVMRF
ncbi:MAG: hypothetical protein AAGD09_20425 [Cyanobacteria bacterium P01_F01_bin.56]